MMAEGGAGVDAYSDEELMQRVCDGDVARLGLLFERHQRRLFNYMLRIVGKAELSEDLTQEVFFRLLKYRASYKKNVPFLPWLYRIARNVSNDHFRGIKGQLVPFEEEEEPSFETDPLEGMSLDWDLASLRQALAELTPEKREVLVLSRFEGMKYEHIAELTGISVVAVKVRVHRALKELRTRFQKIWKEQVS